MSFERIYPKIPVFLQNVACNLYGFKESRVRFNSSFRRKLKCLINSEESTEKEISDYQRKSLENLLFYCKRNNSFYKERLRNVDSVDDWVKVPVLTKKEVVKKSEDLLSFGFRKSELVKKQTSGTTGSSLEFWNTKGSTAFQWAVWWRHRNRFKISPGDWHVNFTGRPVVPINQTKPPFWRWDFFRKQLIINMQSLNARNIRHIAKAVDKKRFRFYSGAPSMLHSFAVLLKENNIEIRNKPSVIFTGAENLLDYQKELLEEVFSCPISDQYGFTEACGNASKCEHGYYHEDWEFGLLECENKIYNPDGSYTGNILATGFADYAFPFIRYRVGDVGTWMPDDFICPCGRKSKTLKFIDGRIEDYVLTPEGNRIMRFSYLFKETSGIQEAQVVQEELGSIIIKYIPNKYFSNKEKEIVIAKIRKWISPTLEVHFQEVQALEKSKSGKLRAVISRLN